MKGTVGVIGAGVVGYAVDHFWCRNSGKVCIHGGEVGGAKYHTPNRTFLASKRFPLHGQVVENIITEYLLFVVPVLEPLHRAALVFVQEADHPEPTLRVSRQLLK